MSTSPGQTTFKLELENFPTERPVPDEVKVTFPGVDLDIDSDNRHLRYGPPDGHLRIWSLPGHLPRDPRDPEVRELKKQVERRDQVIGELTIANRIQKNGGGLY